MSRLQAGLQVRLQFLPVILAMTALLLLAGAAVARDRQPARQPQAWAYAGWWLPDGWRSVPLAGLDRVLLFELKVDGSGQIVERHGWPDQWSDMRSALALAKVPLDLTLTLSDPAAFYTLFASPEASARLLDEAVALGSHPDAAGLHLDFEIYEPIPAATLDAYRFFVRALAGRLRQAAPARNLSVFFPIGGASALYDAPTLALLDQVVLQGYDAHWKTGATAGPVAPLAGSEVVTWKKAVAIGIAAGVPKQRLLLGFPLYGYEWPVGTPALRGPTTGPGQHTSFAPLANPPQDMPDNVMERIRQHGARHDAVSASSYYRFTRADGAEVEGWFEDAWALVRKSDYLIREQLGGIAFFMLGYDDGALVKRFIERRRRARTTAGAGGGARDRTRDSVRRPAQR